MKIYKVTRAPGGVITERVICVVKQDKAFPEPIAYHLPHVVFHSPTGFECGYGGSGPADLALSIMADHWGVDPKTMRQRIRGWTGEHGHAADGVAGCYQDFKFEFIAAMHLKLGETAQITSYQIADWLAARFLAVEQAAAKGGEGRS